MQHRYRPPPGAQGASAPPPDSLTSSLPPPQRPPAGYRPPSNLRPLPPGVAPPNRTNFPQMAAPCRTAVPNSSQAGVPVEKMASMNISQPSSQLIADRESLNYSATESSKLVSAPRTESSASVSPIVNQTPHSSVATSNGMLQNSPFGSHNSHNMPVETQATPAAFKSAPLPNELTPQMSLSSSGFVAPIANHENPPSSLPSLPVQNEIPLSSLSNSHNLGAPAQGISSQAPSSTFPPQMISSNMATSPRPYEMQPPGASLSSTPRMNQPFPPMGMAATSTGMNQQPPVMNMSGPPLGMTQQSHGMGIPRPSTGIPGMNQRPSFSTSGPVSGMNQGPPGVSMSGPLGMNQQSPSMSMCGPPGVMNQRPSMSMSGPPGMNQQPPSMSMSGPPGVMNQRPSMSMSGPLGMNQQPPSMSMSGAPPGLNRHPYPQAPNVNSPNPPPMGPGMSSYPPTSNMQNRYPGSSGMDAHGLNNQGSQGRRLNPDDMPSPLQVIEEDRQNKSGEFFTNLKGALPPLVTTDFIVKDGGNASPRFIRSSMYSIPATPDMMKQCLVPFSLIVSPFADIRPGEASLYTGTSLENGPVRCLRCKGYMSPLMIFMDGGRRYQCLLCKHVNEVPADYFCHMDSQGARADKCQRPELCLGSFEYVATGEYCKDRLLPKEPAYIFILEVTQLMVQRGIINLICQNMKSILQNLPVDTAHGQEASKSSIHVGFITYDSMVHFYRLSGREPEMCTIADKETMFAPYPEGLLCDAEQVSDNITKLMENIPVEFQSTKETAGALYSAIEAGMVALDAAGRAGKLFIFNSSLPHFDGIGKLKNREDRKLLGTDKEKSILLPQTSQYNDLAQSLVSSGCGVDFYTFSDTYVDLATVGQVARLTGGQCYRYPCFQPNKDGDRLLEDVKMNVGRNIAFDAVMRVRTSTGVRPVDFFGHFYMANTHDIELATIDSNKAIAVEIKHDDKLTDEDGVYIQVALLYTSVGGQRRLRVSNLALDICVQMADLYKNCDLDTLMNFFCKQSIFKLLDSSAKQVKENLIARSAQILSCYRKNCATPSASGQLILPEMMKLLPLYVNCLMKCDAISGGQDLTCDERSWHMYQLSTMLTEATIVYLYPRLIPLMSGVDSSSEDSEVNMMPVRTSYEKLSAKEAFLLENGLFMFLWVGAECPASWINAVFGVSASHQLDPTLSELPDMDNEISRTLRDIVSGIREERKNHMRLFVVPQNGKHEIVMRNYLVEDKGVYGTPSYIDFLCHVHREIRVLLS